MEQTPQNRVDQADEFNQIASEIFTPIYPVIAQMIIEKCKITHGTCLDIGCGPGHLSIAIAKATDLDVLAMDCSESMLAHAEKNIRSAGLSDRIRTLQGDVHAIPLEDNRADLVISRGSVPFWKDKPLAFSQVRRILKNNGKGFIGCGMGSDELKNEIYKKMRRFDPDWDKQNQERKAGHNPVDLEVAAKSAGFATYSISRDGRGIWTFLKKSP